MEVIAKLPPGTSSYVDTLILRTGALTLSYRIDALGSGGRAVGQIVSIAIDIFVPSWRDKDDRPVYILVPDGRTPLIQDFEDFLAFVRAFNTKVGDPNFNVLADTNGDGEVSFIDFVDFAMAYGRTAVSSAAP